LIVLFGAFALVNGVLSIFLAVRAPKGYPRFGSLLLGGLCGIFAGILTFIWPGLTALGLLIMIAAWAIVTGILETVAAIKLRKEIKGEWLLIVAGLCSVVFGVLLMLMPGAGALALVLWIGAYALVFGLLLMVLAFKVRRLGKEVLTPSGGALNRNLISDQRRRTSCQMPVAHNRTYKSEKPTQNKLSQAHSM